MVPDRISRETVIAAPPDIVWAFVTESRHVARWFSDEPAEGTSTLVAITLSAEGRRTGLRVVETGFQALTWAEEDKARCADENSEGWVHELTELRDYAARVAGDRS